MLSAEGHSPSRRLVAAPALTASLPALQLGSPDLCPFLGSLAVFASKPADHALPLARRLGRTEGPTAPRRRGSTSRSSSRQRCQSSTIPLRLALHDRRRPFRGCLQELAPLQSPSRRPSSHSRPPSHPGLAPCPTAQASPPNAHSPACSPAWHSPVSQRSGRAGTSSDDGGRWGWRTIGRRQRLRRSVERSFCSRGGRSRRDLSARVQSTGRHQSGDEDGARASRARRMSRRGQGGA